MSTTVRDLKIDSGNDYATATIVVSRSWTSRGGRASDLPPDIRKALIDWLGCHESRPAQREWEPCGRGPCSANAGHEGKCVL